MSCNKISYASSTDAKEAVRFMRSSVGGKVNAKLTSYKCYKCRRWHLTSIPKKQRRILDKQKKEISRRLFIIKQISKIKTLDSVLVKQEYWMTLVTQGEELHVEFDVLNGKKILQLQSLKAAA